ncbi:hypothetical protein BCR36DRAFT_587512 [Piromyces finnis]|uniref:Uncharacterized protein n=1 Tax=Piromyces finnis TaxID=1754191 RepID=A0A1Y1UVJ6_9FUNG|nr:hypothetical protein BCR36DRAFT_587512 [Piromyces finnis]|eukprot:ORX42027.1 hypothetical protein BCR36DRAFT_587512 [Piromyces finnis]
MDCTEQITEKNDYLNSPNISEVYLTETTATMIDSNVTTEIGHETEDKHAKYQFNHENNLKNNKKDISMYTMYTETEIEIETEDHDNELPNTYTELEGKNGNFVNEVIYIPDEELYDINSTIEIESINNKKAQITIENIPPKEVLKSHEIEKQELEIETENEKQNTNIISESELEYRNEVNNETETELETEKLPTQEIIDTNTENELETEKLPTQEIIDTNTENELETEKLPIQEIIDTNTENELETEKLPTQEIIDTNTENELETEKLPIQEIINTNTENELENEKLPTQEIIDTNTENELENEKLPTQEIINTNTENELENEKLPTQEIIDTNTENELENEKLPTQEIIDTNTETELETEILPTQEIIDTNTENELENEKLPTQEIIDTNTENELETENLPTQEIIDTNTENELETEKLPTQEATNTEIETELEIGDEDLSNHEIIDTNNEIETEFETEIPLNQEIVDTNTETELETEIPLNQEIVDINTETELEIEILPTQKIMDTNNETINTLEEKDNDTKLLDTPLLHEKTSMMDFQKKEQNGKENNTTFEKNNSDNNTNVMPATSSLLTIPTDNHSEKYEFKMPFETESEDTENVKTFEGYIDSVFNDRSIDFPNELSKLYMDHINEEEKKYESSASTNVTESERGYEGITKEAKEVSPQQPKLNAFNTINDMVVIDVLNNNENKKENTFLANPDTAGITSTADKKSNRIRSLKRLNAFYHKKNDENSTRKVKLPKVLFSFNEKMNFKYKHETHRNYILKRLLFQKQNSIAIATLKNNMKWSDESLPHPHSASSSSSSSTTASSNHETNRSDLYKKAKYVKRIMNKYNLSSFISRQHYKAKLKLDYYKAMYQRRQFQPKKNFQDYIKEYDQEKYEMNPYFQEIINEQEENGMVEKEASTETESEYETCCFDEGDKKSKMKVIHNLLVKHENHQHKKYENQDIPLIEKKGRPTSLNFLTKLEKKREQEKENEKKMDSSYYLHSYEDERNSRNIYLSDDYSKETYQRQSKFNQKELNKLIFKEMQKRKMAQETYSREKFGEKLGNLHNKKSEYYHFKSDNYLLESPQEQMERELKDMHQQHKKMVLQNQSLKSEKVIIDIQEPDYEKNNEIEEEKEVLLNKTKRPLNRKVSFKMDFVDEEKEEGEEEMLYHEPLKNIKPLKLKSCLSKQPVDYDKKLSMKYQMELKNGKNINPKIGGNSNPQRKEIIASSIVNEYTPEINSYIGDSFGNYFTGYTYNNYYYFNGKNYTLISMLNPKMFYREYFDNENTIKTNEQLFRRYTKLFKMINLYRSIITTIYGVYELYENLIDENIQKFGAIPFILIEFFFLLTDLLVAFIKAYPNKTWFLWNVSDWDPIKNTWTVWSLVANHEIVMEILPVMINVILKVYHFRLSQIMESPEVGSIFNDNSIPSLNLNDLNQVSLILFVFSLVSQLICYAIRIDGAILSRCNTFGLAAVVFVKVLLMVLDITTNLLILYEYLVTLGTEIFTFNGITWVLFSILLFSFIVTLCTNVIINIPLHYYFLRMGIKVRLDSLFIEYAEQLREYQYKTHSLDTYNKNNTTLTEKTLNEIFDWNHNEEENGKDTSTTNLLKETDNKYNNEKENFLDINTYTFDPHFNYHNRPKEPEENITNKIATIINNIFPSNSRHQEMQFVDPYSTDDVINVNIIDSNGSIEETTIRVDVLKSSSKNNEQTRENYVSTTVNSTKEMNTSTTEGSKLLSSPKIETTTPGLLNKDLIGSLSSSSSSNSFIIGSLKEKEIYDSIDELNNCTSNTYERQETTHTTNNYEKINKHNQHKEVLNVLSNLGSTTSINQQQQQQQYIYTKNNNINDFTKVDLMVKEENINEGIYKYYAKTMADIENKINQLHHIRFKHVIQVSVKKAFHPFLIILFIYNIYMLYALYLVLNRIWNWNPITAVMKNGATLHEAGLIPDSSFFGWNTSSSSSGFKFHWFVWINIVFNYLSGAILPIFYWISIVLYNISSVRKRTFLHYL